MIYVIREGKLVPKRWSASVPGGFPAPMVSRFAPMESPVTGKTISSWRERDRDMDAANCADPRDFPKDHVFKKGRRNGRA